MTSSIFLGILLLAPAPAVAAAQEAPASAAPSPTVPAESPSEPQREAVQPEVAPQPPENAPAEPAVKPRRVMTCRSRSDCDPLRCLRHACVDYATFVEQRTVTSKPPEPDESTRVYFGGAFGGPLPVLWNSQVGVGLQAAARVGVLVSHLQLQLEVSPASTVLFSVGDRHEAVGLFEAAVTVGYLVPLSPFASWILRVGGGGGFTFPGVRGDPATQAATTKPAATGFGEIRFDFLGVAVRASDHLLVELNAPSCRVLLPGGGAPTGMMFVTNLAFVYLF